MVWRGLIRWGKKLLAIAGHIHIHGAGEAIPVR